MSSWKTRVETNYTVNHELRKQMIFIKCIFPRATINQRASFLPDRSAEKYSLPEKVIKL